MPTSTPPVALQAIQSTMTKVKAKAASKTLPLTSKAFRPKLLYIISRECLRVLTRILTVSDRASTLWPAAKSSRINNCGPTQLFDYTENKGRRRFMDGKPYIPTYFKLDDLKSGKHIIIKKSAKPNPEWGKDEKDYPYPFSRNK